MVHAVSQVVIIIYSMICEHVFWDWSYHVDASRGTNWPSLKSQPISVTMRRTASMTCCMELFCETPWDPAWKLVWVRSGMSLS